MRRKDSEGLAFPDAIRRLSPLSLRRAVALLRGIFDLLEDVEAGHIREVPSSFWSQSHLEAPKAEANQSHGSPLHSLDESTAK